MREITAREYEKIRKSTPYAVLKVTSLEAPDSPLFYEIEEKDFAVPYIKEGIKRLVKDTVKETLSGELDIIWVLPIRNNVE